MTAGNGTTLHANDNEAPESGSSTREAVARVEERKQEYERDTRGRDAEVSIAILNLIAQAKADREVASHRHDAVIGSLHTLTDWVNRHDAQHAGQDRHRAQLDSINEERDTAIEATAEKALSRADQAWGLAGKGSVLTFAGGGLVTLIKYLFF